MKRRQFWYGLGSSLCMLILILDSRTALAGARDGIDLCLKTVVPGLFPFFVLSILLTGNLTGTRIPFLRPLGKFLGIPAGCESLLIPAFLGGYPSGAQCVGQAFRRGQLTREDALRLLFFCNQAGPSFLFGVLGTVYSGTRTVWILWAVQVSSALLCAAAVYRPPEKTCDLTTDTLRVSDALSGGIRITASVCGWVTGFRVVTAFLERWFLMLFPAPVRVAITGILELSNGCCMLPTIADGRTQFLITCGLLSFGGICVLMQTASVIADLPLGPYLTGKILQSILSLLLGSAVVYISPWILLVVPFFGIALKKTVAILRTMMYNGSITQRRNPYAVSKKNRARLRLLSPGNAAGRGSDPLLQKRTAQR